MSNRWSLLASYGWTKSFDQAATIQGNSIRGNGLAVNPERSDQRERAGPVRVHAADRQVERHVELAVLGYLDLAAGSLPAGHPLRPDLPVDVELRRVRFLAEPLGTRRQDDILIADLRVEKTHRFGGSRDISVFFDLYNMFNENPAQNLQWSSGTAFDRPLSIVPPRLARIGVKLNF